MHNTHPRGHVLNQDNSQPQIKSTSKKESRVTFPVKKENLTLRSSQHHSFDVELARQLNSVNLALLIHHFQFWINKNMQMGINFYEGRTWTYQTLEEICAIYIYLSVPQVKRLLQELVDRGILRKGNFNKNVFDKTTWYSFEDEKSFTIGRIRPIDETNSSHPLRYNNKKDIREKVVKVIEREAKAPPPPSFSQKRKSEERAPAITDEQKSELESKIGEKEASKRIANAIKTLTNPRFANSPYRSMSVYDLALLYHENSKKERANTEDGRKEHNKEKAKSFLQANPHLDMLELTQNAVIFHHNGQGEEPTVFYKSTQFVAEMKEILDRWRLEYRWPPGDG